MGTKHPFVGSILVSGVYIFTYDPWSKDSLLPMGKIWFLDFLGMQNISKYVIYSESASERERERESV